MTITWVQFAWAVGILIVWSGFLVGIIRQMLFRLYVDLKAEVDAVKAEQKKNDAEFKSFLIALPLNYYRREDAVREFTSISTKLDRLYEIYSRVMKHA